MTICQIQTGVRVVAVVHVGDWVEDGFRWCDITQIMVIDRHVG